MILLYVVVLVSLLSLGFAWRQAISVTKKSPGTEKMEELSNIIHKGALTFLHKEYITLGVFIVIVTACLYYFIGQTIAIAFVCGALLSASSGNIGMRIATKANARAAEGARNSINEGMKIAFNSGTVMGLCVVGLGLLGVTFMREHRRI